MNDVSWDNQNPRMMNGPEMAGIRQQNFSTRSQDDATVGYFFQRPQTDAEMNSNYPGKRWAIGDDSVIEQVFCFCWNKSGDFKEDVNKWPAYFL